MEGLQLAGPTQLSFDRAAVALEVERVVHKSDDWWFDPRLLQWLWILLIG